MKFLAPLVALGAGMACVAEPQAIPKSRRIHPDAQAYHSAYAEPASDAGPAGDSGRLGLLLSRESHAGEGGELGDCERDASRGDDRGG